MAEGKINLYGLATKGVNVTKSAIHLADGELTNAQNIVPDPRGEFGGVKTRDGLTAINGSAMSTPVLGIVAVAQPIVTTRTIFVGRQDTSEVGQGWNTTTDAFATAATAVTTPASPKDTDPLGDIAQVPGSSANEEYKLGQIACVANNKLYYAANGYTQSTDAPPIRVYDPVTLVDEELIRIPTFYNVSTGEQAQLITNMIAVGQIIYICTSDDNNAGAFQARVFKLDLSTGGLTQLGQHFASSTGTGGGHECPISAEYAMGRLWVGTRGTAAAGGEGKVWWIDPSLPNSNLQVTWTNDHELAVNANGSSANAIKQYKGNIYVATSVSNNAIAGIVEQRTPAGTWSSSLTGASATAYNGFVDLCVFQDNLYATYWSAGPTATIHKFNGSSWSTVFTGAGSQRVPLRLARNQQDTVLFAWGYNNAGNDDNTMLTSTDGSSWNDRTANINDRNLAAFGELQT